MKILILLIAIGVTSQKLDQRSATRAGSSTKEVTAAQSLENRLLDRAKLIYGPDLVRTITLKGGRPPRATQKAEAEPMKRNPNDSRLDDSTDMEEPKKEASYKGDAASGVILLEEKDASTSM